MLVRTTRNQVTQFLATSIIGILLILSGCSHTQGNEASAPIRTALEQMSDELSKELGMPVFMSVQQHQIYSKKWHFYVGYPVHGDGTRIDVSQTSYREDFLDGFFDDIFMALFLDSGEDQPTLIRHSYGATDAPFVEWAEAYQLPLCFFDEQNECT